MVEAATRCCSKRDSKLKHSACGEEDAPATSYQSFPNDSLDDIQLQPQPLRLSQEECEQCSQTLNQFQSTVWKHIEQRLKMRPMKYISLFQIKFHYPKVSLEKALAMRYKVAYYVKLRQLVQLTIVAIAIYQCCN